jgi:lipopolysaccharide export system permease protein
MKSLSRYVLKETLTLTFALTLVFSAAVWLVQSLRLIDLLVNRGLSVGLFMELAMLIFPRFIEIVLPIAIFLAILFSYNRLISESELIVMRAAGLSQTTLARPALILASIGALILLVLSTYVLPAANREFKDLQFEIRNHFASALIQEGVFNTLSDRLTVYVRSRDRRGELGGLIIHDTRDPKRPVTLFAEQGALVDTPDGPRVLMANGSRQQFDEDGGKLAVLSFERYTLDLQNNKEVVAARQRQPDERYLHELLFDNDEASRRAFGTGLTLELHLQLLAPFAAIVFALIPLVCLLPGDFNRRGQGRRILAAIVCAVLFQIIDLGCKNLASHNMAAVPLLYLDMLLPIAAGAWLLMREGRWPWLPRLPSPASA